MSQTNTGPGKIKVRRNPTADSRTCDFANVSKQTLLVSSIRHIDDVRAGLEFLREKLYHASVWHDWDKIEDIDSFHADFVTGFAQTGWWDRHRQKNRHHLMAADGVRDDVNLIDVLDMISDIVMAGMARQGSVYPAELPPGLLEKAFHNTVELLKNQVVVVEPESR
jgi:hypothetical protein